MDSVQSSWRLPAAAERSKLYVMENGGSLFVAAAVNSRVFIIDCSSGAVAGSVCADNTIRALTLDPMGSMWVAVDGGGLLAYPLFDANGVVVGKKTAGDKRDANDKFNTPVKKPLSLQMLDRNRLLVVGVGCHSVVNAARRGAVAEMEGLPFPREQLSCAVSVFRKNSAFSSSLDKIIFTGAEVVHMIGDLSGRVWRLAPDSVDCVESLNLHEPVQHIVCGKRSLAVFGTFGSYCIATGRKQVFQGRAPATIERPAHVERDDQDYYLCASACIIYALDERGEEKRLGLQHEVCSVAANNKSLWMMLKEGMLLQESIPDLMATIETSSKSQSANEGKKIGGLLRFIDQLNKQTSSLATKARLLNGDLKALNYAHQMQLAGVDHRPQVHTEVTCLSPTLTGQDNVVFHLFLRNSKTFGVGGGGWFLVIEICHAEKSMSISFLLPKSQLEAGSSMHVADHAMRLTGLGPVVIKPRLLYQFTGGAADQYGPMQSVTLPLEDVLLDIFNFSQPETDTSQVAAPYRRDTVAVQMMSVSGAKVSDITDFLAEAVPQLSQCVSADPRRSRDFRTPITPFSLETLLQGTGGQWLLTIIVKGTISIVAHVRAALIRRALRSSRVKNLEMNDEHGYFRRSPKMREALRDLESVCRRATSEVLIVSSDEKRMEMKALDALREDYLARRNNSHVVVTIDRL
mmetsp:Transcript_10506/g.32140  ORF Transcript_10506/g.32140 Transcript_10506/m.32140 type:complete len:688 (-) Transcript_10506:777-2840(-)